MESLAIEETSVPQLSVTEWTKMSSQTPMFTFLCNEDAVSLYRDIPIPGGGRGDSGVDLRFPEDVYIAPLDADPSGLPTIIDLKIRARCFRDGNAAPYMIVPRSSIAKTPLQLANSIGIVDQGYIGTLKVAIRNMSTRGYTVKKGISLFQVIIPNLTPASLSVFALDGRVVEETPTVRGEGGFGSTGTGGSWATQKA